jgi:hypothetical protein
LVSDPDYNKADWKTLQSGSGVCTILGALIARSHSFDFQPARWLTPVGVALVLLLHAWLALSASLGKSTAVDEMPHLMAGHAMWATGDYRLQPENGNLPQRWEGLPAWLHQRRLPESNHPGWRQPNVWTLGHFYFHEIGNDLPRLLLEGRAMNVCWSLAVGILIFIWTRKLFGQHGAWIALLLWAFCPTFLAHGAFATSDMCMTFLMLACVGAYWRHLQNLSWQNGLLSAVLLGLAFVAKYSAVLLPVMFGLLVAIRVFWRQKGQGNATGRFDRLKVPRHPRERSGFQDQSRSSGNATARWRPQDSIAALLISTAGHIAVVVVTIWFFHGFRFAPTTDPTLVQDYTRPWSVVLADLGGFRATVLQWARTWHLLPDAYLYGFAFVLDLADMRGAFLNGATSYTGWVQFFPYAFLVKTPIAVLLAGLASVAIAAGRWSHTGIKQAAADLYRFAPLLVLFVVYWAVSLTSHLNIGQRHLLPIYPVVFISIGALGWAAVRWGRAWMVVAAMIVVGQIVASTSVRPHYLAFFNALAGGPTQGYRHLVDSSLDWGQDLPGLKTWLGRNTQPSDRVYFSYFGTGEPTYYGIKTISMAPLLRTPAAHPWYTLHGGVYCISATMLSQAYSSVREPWSVALERQYQTLRGTEPALLDYAAHAERRPALEKEIPAAQWNRMWERYEQLRFARLCWYLRAREPDAQIGYSINIYRLSDAEVEEATGGSLEAWRAGIERELKGGK